MPTVTPLPSTAKAERAPAALSWASPSDLTAPPQSAPRTSGASASVTAATPATAPMRGRSAGRSRDGHRPVAAADVDDLGAGRAQGRRARRRRRLEADFDEDAVAVAQQAAGAAGGEAELGCLLGPRRRAQRRLGELVQPRGEAGVGRRRGHRRRRGGRQRGNGEQRTRARRASAGGCGN